MEHLSPQDFASFLSGPFRASIVITENLWLMAVKTKDTPSLIYPDEIVGIINRADRAGILAGRDQNWPRRVTKLVADKFALEIYICSPEERGTFRAIKLKGE